MASLGHIAVGMTAARLYRRKQPSRRPILASMALWSLLSLLPDADVIGFRLGIRYGDAWGHRGATHSFAWSLALAVAIGLVSPRLGVSRITTAAYAFTVLASHALLDTLTDGGLGCALFWPFDLERYFAPWRPIPVAPLGLSYFTMRGLRVAVTELLMFMPLLIYALWPRAAKHARSQREL
jgi:inner membrane protein